MVNKTAQQFVHSIWFSQEMLTCVPLIDPIMIRGAGEKKGDLGDGNSYKIWAKQKQNQKKRNRNCIPKQFVTTFFVCSHFVSLFHSSFIEMKYFILTLYEWVHS